MIINPYAFGVAGWLPSDETGLYRWYRPEGLSGFADNDPIGTWPDDSPSAVGATAAGSARPTCKTSIVNGKSVARFDGADDVLALGNWSALTEGEVFIVLKLDADPPAADAQTGLWDTAGANNSHFPYTDGTIYETFGTDTRKTTVNPTPSLSSTFRIYNVYSATNDWQSYLDGTSLYSTATNTVAFGTAVILGRSLAVIYFLDGDVAELFIFDHKLSSGARADAVAYCQSKYAL